MRSLKKAYLLMLPTLFGVAGLHRIYMGKVVSGIIWLCTWGLGGLGTLYDAFTMAKQIARADAEQTGHWLDPSEYWRALGDSMPPDRPAARRIRQRYGTSATATGSRKETLEITALRLARDSGGIVSPALLALESGVGSDVARKELDRLSMNGIAEPRNRRNGVMVYVFPEFLDPGSAADLDPL